MFIVLHQAWALRVMCKAFPFAGYALLIKSLDAALLLWALPIEKILEQGIVLANVKSYMAGEAALALCNSLKPMHVPRGGSGFVPFGHLPVVLVPSEAGVTYGTFMVVPMMSVDMQSSQTPATTTAVHTWNTQHFGNVAGNEYWAPAVATNKAFISSLPAR